MPLVYGKIHPEIEEGGLLSYESRILIEPKTAESTIPLLVDIGILKEYLKDIDNCPINIKIFVISNENTKGYENFEIELVSKPDDLLVFLKEQNIDIFTSEDADILKKLKEEKELNSLPATFEEARKEIEIFVRGHEIPWAMNHPTWYMPWTVFYSMNDELGRKGNEFNEFYAEKFKGLGLDPETVEAIRSLTLNRLSNILYTRDKLLFYVQQRRFSKRQEKKRQGFDFEASYYLCHYYLLLWGALDQLARILNGSLSLGFTHFRDINILNDKFAKKLKAVSPDIAALFENEEFQNWSTQLRRSRHYTAHQGSIVLSPILEKPDSEPTDEDLQKEAESTPAWSLMKRNLPPQAFEWYVANLKEQLKIARLKVLVEDAMVIKDTFDNQQYIFRPLGNIEWDFKNFELTIVRTLETLSEYLNNKET